MASAPRKSFPPNFVSGPMNPGVPAGPIHSNMLNNNMNNNNNNPSNANNPPKNPDQFWLIKIPSFVAEEWKKVANQPGKHIGNFKFDQSDPAEKKYSIELPPDDKIPSHYKGKVRTKPPPKKMLVFSENLTPNGQPFDNNPNFTALTTEKFIPCNIRGGVELVMDVAPSSLSDPKYQRLLRNRAAASMVKSKGTSKALVENDQIHVTQQMRRMEEKKRMQAEFNRDNEKGSREKRQRMEKDVLINKLNRLFDKKQYWTIKDINAALPSQQPETYLKDTLKTIADYQEKGEKIHHWSIKSSARLASDQPEQTDNNNTANQPAPQFSFT